MHNYPVTSKPTVGQLHSANAIVEQACSNDMYSVWLNADMLSEGGHAAAATYVAGTTSDGPHWILSDGVVSGVTAYVRRHPEWKAGSFKMKVHWTSTVAGDSVRLGVAAQPVNTGAAFTAFTIFGENWDGPATANYMMLTEFNNANIAQASAINQSSIGIRVDIRRSTTNDTNTGDVKIYGIELIYFETQRVIGDRYSR